MKTVGFIGLGNMGAGMVKNLLANQFAVIGFDIDKDKLSDLTSKGLQPAASVKEIASKCQTVILCLPHPDATRQVIFDELLTDENTIKTIIETSTLTPEIVIDIADKLAKKGKQFLSAPMIGGKNAANDQTIQFLVEGSKEVYEGNLEILKAMSSRVDYMGDLPSATLAKLMFNLCRYANLATAVEVHRLLKSYSPNMEAIYSFMTEQSLDNFGQVWGEDMKDTMTKNDIFKPSQVPKKDLELLSKMAQDHQIDSGLIDAIRSSYLSME